MSRLSGESDNDCDYNNGWALWEQSTKNALGGKRGQAILRELEADLMALPRPRLMSGTLASNGEVCALGALAVGREQRTGKDFASALGTIQNEVRDTGHRYSESYHGVMAAARLLSLPKTIAVAIVQENDGFYELGDIRTPEQRYTDVLAWVRSQLSPTKAGG